MTTLTVGRFNFSVEEGLDIEQSGDEMRVSGETIFSDVTEAAAFAVQLNGYADSADEEVIPVVYAEMPDLTGFYRVRDLKISRPVETSYEGLFPFRVTLERVRQSAAPLQQITHQGRSRITGSWNLAPNSSGESGTTGLGLYAGPGGTSAASNPVVTTSFGTRVLRSQWSVATSSAGGGVYQETPAVAGARYSVGINHVRSTISTRLALRLRFLDVSSAEISGTSVTVQVTGGVTYTATDFKVESQLAPVGTVKIQVQLTSVSGTGFANWTNGSQLDTDGWVVNLGTTMIGNGALEYNTFANYAPHPWVRLPSGAYSLRFVGTEGDSTTQFYVSPSDYYNDAPLLKLGDPLSMVVGRQVPNTPNDWVLGNGAFEVRPGTSGVSFEIRHYASGVWSSWSEFELLAADASGVTTDLTTPAVLTVLRNSCESVTIRLMTTWTTGVGFPWGDSAPSPITVDITLLRGSPFIRIEVSSSQSLSFHIHMDSFSAAAAGPFHYRASDDRFVSSASPLLVTTDPSDIRSLPNSRWSIAVGYTSSWKTVGVSYYPHLAALWGGSEDQKTVLL